ncbi:MAG TPA: DsbA family protein [Nannocystaceae bacterium]|nr:DsbA family protein [Nannocystaceae bacterium]
MSADPSSGPELRFFYDVVCPYAFLASTRVEAFAAERGRSVTWCPVLLGGLLRRHGGPDDPNATYSPVRGRMGRADILRSAEWWNVPLAIPAEHPRRTVDAMRLVVAAGADRRVAVSRALFEAYWCEGRDVADRRVLADVARAHGLAIEAIADERVRTELRARTDEAADAGVFGVPTFAIGDACVWGQDRLAVLARALGAGPSDPAAALPGPRPGMRVRFFHDVSSPFSYLASTQIERVCAAAGAELEAVPILLGALFRDIGTADVPLFEMHAAKQAWVRRDLDDWAALWGVPLRFRSSFPLRSVLPQRALVVEPRAMAAVYRATWVDDRAVDRPDVLGDVLAAAGFAAPEILAQTERAEIKDALRRNTEAARAAGACGVPSFEITRAAGDRRVVWGQDRLPMLAAMLAGFWPSV